MNSGRISKRSHALFGVLALFLALAGCAVGRLSDRFVIDRMTRVTDADGQPVDLASDGDFLHVATVGQEGDQGMKLGPGAILTYVRWSPGFATPDKVSNPGLRYEPVSESYRIVLRHVDEGRGELRDEEERFLASVLTVHRRDWGAFESGSVAQLQPVLYRSRKLLWNALVDDLAIRRVGPGPEVGLVLLPTFRLEALCAAFKARTAKLLDENETAKAAIVAADFTQFAKAFVPGGEGECTPGKGRILELTAMPMGSLKSVIHGAASDDIPDNSESYYYAKGSLINIYTRFNFATAELNGVRVNRPDVPEAAWTLREWEDSGICRIPGQGKSPVIRRLLLTGGLRPLWISRGGHDPHATYRLVSVLTRDNAARKIERISNVGLFDERTVLDESALDILRMSDLKWIEWAIPGERVDRHRAWSTVQPSGCYFASMR